MKKFCYTLFFFITAHFCFAQAPLGINYQGVARNAQGQALTTQTVKVRVSLIKEDDVNVRTTFYTETRTVTTNALGLFSFVIGQNQSTSTGFITSGNWNDGNTQQFLKVELDVANSGTWTDMGTQQIFSVPYALYATEAAEAKSLSAAPITFAAVSTTVQTIPISGTAKITFEAIEAGSTAFNTATSAFTAPTTGKYHFDGVITGSTAAPLSTTRIVRVEILVNGTVKKDFRYRMTPDIQELTCPFSAILNLSSGDVVTIQLHNATQTEFLPGQGYTYFNGHLIR